MLFLLRSSLTKPSFARAPTAAAKAFSTSAVPPTYEEESVPKQDSSKLPPNFAGETKSGAKQKAASSAPATYAAAASATKVLPLSPETESLLGSNIKGARMEALEPIGAAVYGLSLKGPRPSPPLNDALELEMAHRGFLVFKDQHELSVDELLKSCTWWGGKKIHSTHGVHPATPNQNSDIFRLSNDPREGITGVGPQWHNDGAFCADTFSHSAYHIIRVPENGGGTHFAHQGAAFDALPKEKRDYWERLVSVNSSSGVLHPMVHTHPISKRKSIFLHLGMTGAVIEKKEDGELRLLEPSELKALCEDYNAILKDGLEQGYTISYDYEEGDVVLIDNLAVAHRAAPEAHMSAQDQGLRVMHRVTVQAKQDFKPPYHFGLPQFMDIYGPNPFGETTQGVWKGGGVGFRWDDDIHMQN